MGRKIVFLLCITYVFAGMVMGPVEAQDDRPVLGRRTKSQPESEPDASKSKVRRRGRRGASDAAASPVPKGKSLEFYVIKGSELLDTGDYELASLYFEEADKRRKDRGVTPELIGLLERQSGVAKLHLEALGLFEEENDKRLTIYEEILKLRPNDEKAKEQVPIIYKKIAEGALAKKDYGRAIELFAQLSSLTPNDDDVRLKLVQSLAGRGKVEMQAGQEEAAQATYRRVLQLDPKNQQALDALRVFDLRGILKMAEEKLAAGAYQEALEKFKELLSIDPVNEQAKRGLQLAQGNYQKIKAEKLYTGRNFSEAEREFKEALTLLPEDEQIKRRLNEISMRLGGALPPKGKTVWRGKIAGPLKVAIKEKELSYPEGEAVREGGTLTDALPDIAYVAKRCRRVIGSADVRIAEQPSVANGYATVVAVNPKKSAAEEVAFEIEWELKRQGRLLWQGSVTGVSLIRVQGPFVDIEQISGAAASDVKYQSEGLPHQEALVKLRKVSGKPEVRLLEFPSQTNLYTATIKVESSSDTEGEALSFELEWQLK
jgi:tetratricopeptide (TPR) repeat protein